MSVESQMQWPSILRVGPMVLEDRSRRRGNKTSAPPGLMRAAAPLSCRLTSPMAPPGESQAVIGASPPGNNGVYPQGYHSLALVGARRAGLGTIRDVAKQGGLRVGSAWVGGPQEGAQKRFHARRGTRRSSPMASREPCRHTNLRGSSVAKTPTTRTLHIYHSSSPPVAQAICAILAQTEVIVDWFGRQQNRSWNT